MYCARCGVEVNNTEKECPLCGGQLSQDRFEARDARPYPENEPQTKKRDKKNSSGVFAFAAFVFSLVMAIANIFKTEVVSATPAGADIIGYISIPIAVGITVAVLFMMVFTLVRSSIQRRFFV